MLFKLVLILFVFSVAVGLNSQLIESLDKLLTFGILNHVKNMNFLIGVAMAKGLLNENGTGVATTKYHVEIKKIINECDILLKPVKYIKDPLSLALSSHLWTLNVPLRSLPLFAPSLSSTMVSVLLSPPLSDSCLRSLLLDCAPPPSCLSAELSDRTSGYPLTHQVLFWTIFQQKCDIKAFEKFNQATIVHKCGQVFKENHNILELGLPSELQDLYLEQVVVCGLHGFKPFLKTFNQDLLLSLQTTEGCFAPKQWGGAGKRKKCDIHLTGVAAAALALFIKHGNNLMY